MAFSWSVTRDPRNSGARFPMHDDDAPGSTSATAFRPPAGTDDAETIAEPCGPGQPCEIERQELPARCGCSACPWRPAEAERARELASCEPSVDAEDYR